MASLGPSSSYQSLGPHPSSARRVNLAGTARRLTLAAALVFPTFGCGSSDAEKPAPSGTSCELDSISGAAALERALVRRGRADADFDAAFGSDSEVLLDAADALRTELVEAAAADQGIELPEGSDLTCPAATGIERQTLSGSTLFAFVMTIGWLKSAVQSAPVSGTTPSNPYMSEESGTLADGSPSHTSTSLDMVISGHDSTVEVMVTSTTSITSRGTTTTESASINASVDVCPDPGGLARGNVVVILDGAVTDVSSYHAESSQNFDFVVNNSAHVASVELTSTLEYRATGAHEADVAVNGNGSLDASLDFTQHQETVDHDNGSSSDAEAFVATLYLFGLAAAQQVQSDTEKKWRGGTCIQVVADPTSEMVLENTALTITATPRHKFDMSNIEAPVVATLTGVASLDPQGTPVAAPADFNYVAGSHFKDLGVVKLKSTSKRGIGEGTSTIQVKCDEDMMCPEGRTLNLETCQCECPNQGQECPSRKHWDEQDCECVCDERDCPGGETLDPDTCECVCELECPTGQTLNEDTCECETSCDIDPMYGNVSTECVWVGTITISSSESGEQTMTFPDETRQTTWTFSYDASLNVTTPDMFQTRLSGGVSGNYEIVEVDTYPMCTLTITTQESVSAELADEGVVNILPHGDGTFELNVWLQGKDSLTGTVTGEPAGDQCGDGYTSMTGADFGTLVGMGTASRSTFSGSNADAFMGGGLELPDQSFAKFTLSWNLRLVRQ